VLNESALKELSLALDKAVGTRVNMNGRRGAIVGVVKDFHFASLHEAIRPLVLFNEEEQLQFIFVKLKPGNVADALAALKAICGNVIPHRPFEYEFLDQKYAALYDTEQRMGTISTVFASLAIVIACLGLFGLVAFAASQKTKEIGIRKVMGATASSIVVLITKDYARLVFISIVIGLPLAYWVIEKWFLSNFIYRATIGVWPFAGAAAACLIIAFGTASYQAVKAAFINPTETLRRE
jgi:putative ABC transport system permease protein